MAIYKHTRANALKMFLEFVVVSVRNEILYRFRLVGAPLTPLVLLNKFIFNKRDRKAEQRGWISVLVNKIKLLFYRKRSKSGHKNFETGRPEHGPNCVEFAYSLYSFILTPQLKVRDRCPECGYETVFRVSGANIGPSEDAWLCPGCRTSRYWRRDEAVAQARQFWNDYIEVLKLRQNPAPWAITSAFFMLQALAPLLRLCVGRPIVAIGHQVFDVALYVSSAINGFIPDKSIEYLDYRGAAVNGAVTARWDRLISFMKYDDGLANVNTDALSTRLAEIKDFSLHNKISFAGGRDEQNFLQRADLPWLAPAAEMSRGLEGLEKMGVPRGAKFACLLVRDEEYDLKARETSFHYPHRNANVDTYRPAMEYLAAQGWYILRMGAKVERNLAWESPQIIDYALKFRTEFMDVWLPSQCDMMISTGAGIDSIPAILRKPLIYTNMPFVSWPHPNYAPLLILTKHFYSSRNGLEISRLEMMKTHRAKIFYMKEFKKAGVKVRDNTPMEILEIVMEMLQIIETGYAAAKDDELLQRRYWETLAAYDPNFSSYAPLYRLGRESLRRDRDFGPLSSAWDGADKPLSCALPWDEKPAYSVWKPSAEMLRKVYAASREADSSGREGLLLSIIWNLPEEAEAAWRLAEVYRIKGELPTAWFFALLGSRNGTPEISGEYARLYEELRASVASEVADLNLDEIWLSRAGNDRIILVDKNLMARIKLKVRPKD